MANGNGNGNGMTLKVAIVVISLLAGSVMTVWFDAIVDGENSRRISANEESIRVLTERVVERLAIIETRQLRSIADIAEIKEQLRVRDE